MLTTVTVRYTKSDLLRLGFYVTLRSAMLKWMTLAVTVMVLMINLNHQRGHWHATTLIATSLTTAIFALGYFVVMLSVIPLLTLLRNRKGSPASETQTYSLSDLGLTRQAASSDTLLKWGGARSLARSKNAIYIGVSASSYYILPRHSVAGDEEYESLWKGLQRLAPDSRGSEV
jgi:hypothetical protein